MCSFVAMSRTFYIVKAKVIRHTFWSMVKSDGVDERGGFGAFVDQGQLTEDGTADNHHLQN